MTTRMRGLLVRTLVSSAIAMLGVAASGTAALADDTLDASVSAGRLVLDPTARGYQGTLSVTVTNDGSDENHVNINLTEPVAGSFGELDPGSPCWYTGYVENRRVIGCAVPGPALEPGERRSFTISFRVLTQPRPYAMIADGGRIDVLPGGSERVTDTATFAALFRATSRSLGSPQPYVQDSSAKASITAVGGATLTRQADGTYTGRMPVTVRYAGDAAHDYLWVEATTLPAGVWIRGTDPQTDPSFSTWFIVPHAEFMAGEERTFDVLIQAPADTVASDLGTARFELRTSWGATDVEDADPSDNTVSFSITAVDNH